MEARGDPFEFILEVDGLTADLHYLGDKPETELRKSTIVVVGLSAGYEIEWCMLEIILAVLEIST